MVYSMFWKDIFRRLPKPIARVVVFYVEGFKEMTLGRWLWALILVKLFILFFVFRLFFFPDVLARDFDNDTDRASAVRERLLDDRRQ